MPIAGYAFCIALLTAGYYYNLTFVQRGLIDLGTTRLGMAGCSVSLVMALLAQAFVAWVVICAGSIGAAMPVTFSFMADLVPVRDRGFVAAVPAGLSFSVASLYPQQWRIEEFSIVMAVAMAPALVVLAALAFRPSPLVDRLARQRARFGSGRFTRAPAPSASTSAFVVIVAAMFAVFFIDSLGFLRIIDTPAYISTSWQSPDPAVRMFIAGLHVAGAAMAGVLNTTFHWRWLLVWVYGLFASPPCPCCCTPGASGAWPTRRGHEPRRHSDAAAQPAADGVGGHMSRTSSERSP